jgi:hypothetical protein
MAGTKIYQDKPKVHPPDGKIGPQVFIGVYKND